MFIAALSALSVGASSVRTTVERQELRYVRMRPTPGRVAWLLHRSPVLAAIPGTVLFDGAHELGRLVVHGDQIWGVKEVERQAQAFATADT